MTADRDRLDEAIDLVARRLTRVEDDELLAARIVAALPERRWWLLSGWTPRLAALAGLAIVLVASTIVLQRSNEGSTQVLLTNGAAQITGLVPGAAQQPALGTEILRRTVVERSSNLRRTAVDHEHALASLALAPLADEPVLEDGLLSVEPLAIVSLPLATESLSLPE